jgi:hypothetical protein
LIIPYIFVAHWATKDGVKGMWHQMLMKSRSRMRSVVHQGHERVAIGNEVNGIIMTTDANAAVVGPGTFQFGVANEGFSLRKQSTIDISEVFVHKDTGQQQACLSYAVSARSGLERPCHVVSTEQNELTQAVENCAT